MISAVKCRLWNLAQKYLYNPNAARGLSRIECSDETEWMRSQKNDILDAGSSSSREADHQLFESDRSQNKIIEIRDTISPRSPEFVSPLSRYGFEDEDLPFDEGNTGFSAQGFINLLGEQSDEISDHSESNEILEDHTYDNNADFADVYSGYQNNELYKYFERPMLQEADDLTMIGVGRVTEQQQAMLLDDHEHPQSDKYRNIGDGHLRGTENLEEAESMLLLDRFEHDLEQIHFSDNYSQRMDAADPDPLFQPCIDGSYPEVTDELWKII